MVYRSLVLTNPRLLSMKKKKNEWILKSEVLLLIQNNIRCIQMIDYGSDDGIPQLYDLYRQVEKMKGVDGEIHTKL